MKENNKKIEDISNSFNNNVKTLTQEQIKDYIRKGIECIDYQAEIVLNIMLEDIDNALYKDCTSCLLELKVLRESLTKGL